MNTVGDWKLKRKLFTFSFISDRLTPVGCGLRLRRSGSGALPTAAPVASAAVFAGRLRHALVLRRCLQVGCGMPWSCGLPTCRLRLLGQSLGRRLRLICRAKLESPKSEPWRALNRRPPAGRTFFCFGLHVDCVWAGRTFLFFWAARHLCLDCIGRTKAGQKPRTSYLNP